MFEHYLHHQVPDTRRRWKLALALNVAGFATAGLVGFTWLMDKMMIAQVAPPTGHFVMVQMSLDSLPPPPPAPPAAPAVKAQDDVKPEPDEDPLTPPEDFTETLPTPRPRVAKVTGTGAPDSTGTLPIGGPSKFGLPGGFPGMPPITGIAVRQPSKPPETRTPVPIATVHAQAIYAPPPDQGKLGATKAATFDRRPGENETAFCVDPTGRTTDVRTVKKFPNDPRVDEICRDTIKTWRFKPFLVDGKPTRTCSVQVFNISFK
ncbi:MAG TPA: energy transducer TonB [Nannocystis sp.]|jgi:protein TonB